MRGPLEGGILRLRRGRLRMKLDRIGVVIDLCPRKCWTLGRIGCVVWRIIIFVLYCSVCDRYGCIAQNMAFLKWM
jgi:hypothetical protein